MRKNWTSGAVEVLVNIALPYLLYTFSRPPLDDVKALLLSTAPPLLWSIVQFVRARRIDALSLFIVAGIVLSLLAFAGGGSVKLLQLRENLVSAVLGLVFLGSALIGKPLIYQLALSSTRRKSAEEAAAFEQRSGNVHFRRVMMQMTVVWGVGLLLQAALACVLVYTLPIGEYLIVGPIAGYVMLGALALWTFWYARMRAARAKPKQAEFPEPEG